MLRIAEALREAGVEVWFDRDALVGGDAWDGKIRGQIAACALFVPIISANTNARGEGYFRLEWKLAVDRSHLMAHDQPYLLPVVVDGTSEAAARVPPEFRAVQWTRLPGGETSVAFRARVQKLVETDVATERPGSDTASIAASTRSVSPAKKSRSLRNGVAGVGVVIVLFVTAHLLWQKSTAPREKSPPAAVAEVRPILRALQLRALTGLSRERLGAAEELLAQALKADPTDADALAVAAQVDALMVFRSWDVSEERRQSATKRSARALALAPEGFEARRAQAMVAAFMLRSPEALQEAEATYRRLSEEMPEDARVLEELGTVLAAQGKFDEAARIFTRAGRPLLAGSAYYWAGRFKPAREICAALLAERRSVEALVLKANIDLFGFNDREAAKAGVSQLTPTELREDDAAGIALRLAVLSADAPGLLKLLDQFPHPFVSILGVNYPRRYWTVMAHEWLQQPEAARIEWQAALQSIEERLKANSADVDALSWAGMLHMCLGDRVATERALSVYRNYRDLSGGYWDFNYCLPLLRLGGREEEVIDRLEKTLRERPNGWFNFIVYAWARFSPEFDPLRKDPRFERLLREMRPSDALPYANAPASAGTEAVPAPATEKSVAVLPFANQSDDKSNEYLSDGVADELLTVLQKIPGLRVAARSSAFSFKGRSLTACEVGEKLGMAHVVEGSVQKSGNRVKITARLSRAATNEELWSESYGPLELTDVFTTQSEIAQKIVAGVRGQLTGGTTSASTAAQAEIKAQVQAATTGGTKNPEAHQLYLQGRFLATRSGSADVARGIDYYEQALKLDPNFAIAWAALARARLWQLSWEPLNPERSQQAQIAATRALAVDSEMAEAHSVIAQVKLRYAFEWRAARAASARALALAPSDVAVLTDAAATEQALGSMEKSIELARRAVALDPVSVDTRFSSRCPICSPVGCRKRKPKPGA